MEKLFDEIFIKSLSFNASDIHFSDSKQGIIQVRSNGKMIDLLSLDISLYKRLMNYIKFLANIDLNYKFKPQTGSFHYSYNNKVYSIRTSFMPSMHGESMVVRILNNHQQLSIEDLSYYPSVLKQLKMLTSKNNGLIIVCGKTGSGKSTTLYTILDSIYQQTHKNIITVEDPIEIYNQHFIQIQLNETMGITFNDTLKQILRHDPDVIMIGEIRDAISAQIALTMALTGHLTLTTLHANNCENAITRLLNLGINKDDLKECLIGVISQRMYYPKRSNQPFCIHEIVLENHINHYFNHDTFSDYDTFDDLLIKAMKANYLTVQEAREV